MHAGLHIPLPIRRPDTSRHVRCLDAIAIGPWPPFRVLKFAVIGHVHPSISGNYLLPALVNGCNESRVHDITVGIGDRLSWKLSSVQPLPGELTTLASEWSNLLSIVRG